MQHTIQRREWLKQSALFTFGMALPFIGKAEPFAKPEAMLYLGSNENPYGLSPGAQKAVQQMLSSANRYIMNVPVLQAFRQRLAAFYGVTEQHLLITAGSSDILGLCGHYFGRAGGNFVAADLTFQVLPDRGKQAGATIITVPLTDALSHDLPAMQSAINADTKLVYVCNPNNPTGTLIPADQLETFTRKASASTTVMIDEAYLDYTEDRSLIPLVKENKRVLIVRTFSKLYAMAGMRVGFAIGHPELISALQAAQYSSRFFNVSNLSMAAAMASLEDKQWFDKVRIDNKKVREYTRRELEKMNIKTADGTGNFLFFPLDSFSGNFRQLMLEQNVVLGDQEYRGRRWCRLTIGTMNEMQQVLPILKKII